MSSSPQILATASQLGPLLQAARKAKGMTQSSLASRIGLSQSRVSHLELNAHELSVEQLLAWCSVLDLELAVGLRGVLTPYSGKSADW